MPSSVSLYAVLAAAAAVLVLGRSPICAMAGGAVAGFASTLA